MLNKVIAVRSNLASMHIQMQIVLMACVHVFNRVKAGQSSFVTEVFTKNDTNRGMHVIGQALFWNTFSVVFRTFLHASKRVCSSDYFVSRYRIKK